jgi:hypothetical protein
MPVTPGGMVYHVQWQTDRVLPRVGPVLALPRTLPRWSILEATAGVGGQTRLAGRKTFRQRLGVLCLPDMGLLQVM